MKIQTAMSGYTFICLMAISMGAAQAGNGSGYWLDSSGKPVKSGSGTCLRSSNWSTQTTLQGCNPQSPAKVVLLPGPDGKVGAVLVQARLGEKLLDKAYEGITVTKEGTLMASQETASSVNQQFGATLQAQPMRPASFTVQFASGSATELTPESKAVFEQVAHDLSIRPAPEITVIGHTDRVGSADANDTLSIGRAQVVKAILLKTGLKADRIDAAGRGEREPLFPTADDIAEPRNRRVEISIR